MQELLGRIAALDPEASVGIRIIACFDELIAGNVNTRGLLATAAALTGCPAGFRADGAAGLRVGLDGEALPAAPPPDGAARLGEASDVEVWLEREGPSHANDALVLERLLLAAGVRRGRDRRDLEPRRDLGVVLDPDVDDDARREAAGRLGLGAARSYRVLAAPLFARWAAHPPGLGDVVPTRHGPIHVLVLPATAALPDVEPAGVGHEAPPAALHRSFATALTALRLSGPGEGIVHADEYGGLLDLLAGSATPPSTDGDLLAKVMVHSWARETVDALLRTNTLREAARLAQVHHSTLQPRVDTLTAELGFNPTHGYGRARLGLSYLTWRLENSRVLDLPTPQGAAPDRHA
ncbi:MAG: PucR family transcriptional regulator [Actinobacteria bacterium]|uniref:Unannotated protein n=1 Tax=freshwater metagenome TaxID=449393 RepID=A0A6J7FTM4_9ZZZZ|nr:PucR family transcriptional regulator [Actinomycetota bacterium]